MVIIHTLVCARNSSNVLVAYPMLWIVPQACITITNMTIVITPKMWIVQRVSCPMLFLFITRSVS